MHRVAAKDRSTRSRDRARAHARWLGVAALFAAHAQAATFTVSKTADTNDGTCDADCSLREAIGAANGSGGADTIAFNIPLADGGYNAGTGVFTIPVSAPLVISDAGTTIDGTTQTANVGNTNPAILGIGGTVGTGPDGVAGTGDEVSLSQVPGPEIELRDSAGVTIGLHVSANDTTIRGLAILGFGTTNGEGNIVVANNITGTSIVQNVLGTMAHTFSDPGVALRGVSGVDSQGGDGGIVRNNLSGFHLVRGIWLDNGSNGWTVQDNEVRDNGLGTTDGDGIPLTASGNNTVDGNYVIGSSSQGVIVTTAGSDNNVISNNTIVGNGVGTASGVAQSAGITLRGSAGPTTFTHNVIQANYGAGLQVNSGATGIVVTQNSIADNGTIVARNGGGPTGAIGIDLQLSSDDTNLGTAPYFNLNDNGDGDSGGNDIDNFAVVEQAQIVAGNLIVNGFSAAGATIEFFVSDNDPSNFGEGQTYLFSRVEGSGQDTDATASSYGPGPINGVAQGSETNVPRYRFVVPVASLVTPPGPGDAIVATATVGGQTSEFGARAPVGLGLVTGRIFVDIVGDGLADGPIGPLPNPFDSGVRIELWRDGGDGLPDGGDDAYQSFTTSALADGSYQFAGLTNGTYWITVDAGGVDRGPYNGGYSGADAWAEQTYGPVGAASFDGAIWSYRATAGAMYGGARWNASNNFPPTNSLPTAEHIARVIVADDTTANVDFGFSFNVVTTTRGGDATVDPGTPPGQRSVQGSLRQFLTNANAQTGGNAMRFVPAAPTNASAGAHAWWQILTSSAQPVVTDNSTIIDGTAYDLGDGTTVIDSNTAAIGAGAAVGLSGTFTTPQLDPELELRGDGVLGVGLEIRAAGDGSAIRDMAINSFALNAVRLIGSNPDALDNATLENTVLGTSPASFTDDPTLSTGRALFARDLTNGVIRNNLAGWFDWGFQVQFDTFDTLIETNEIRGSAVHGLYVAGVASTGQQPARIDIRGNSIESSGQNAISTQQALNQFTITDNTLRLSGSHALNLYATQSTVTANVITDNSGAGIVVIGDNLPTFPAASGTRISQNRFGNNGALAIDLVATGTNADGITLNDDLDADAGGANELHNFPVIESAVLAGGNLTITGFARPGAEIEVYEAVGAANDDNSAGTPHGEGIDYLLTATEGTGADTDAATGSYASAAFGADSAAARFRFVVPAPAGLALGEQVSALSIDTTSDTSEFGPNALVTAPYNIVKRAFLPDGTPVTDGALLPVGVTFKFLLYINNTEGATTDVTIRDVLDPLFGYQPGTLQVDNSASECAAAACTPAEEAAIFAAAIAAPVLTDAVDADVTSFDGTDTVDAGNQFAANGQLNIAANSVLAVVFSAKIQ